MDVPNVSEFTTCRTLSGDMSTSRYYDPDNDYTIISSISLAPDIACFNACGTDTEKCQKCLSDVTPVDCDDPALPIAKSGNVPFYLFGIGKLGCY